jgi:hypothetical protein
LKRMQRSISKILRLTSWGQSMALEYNNNNSMIRNWRFVHQFLPLRLGPGYMCAGCRSAIAWRQTVQRQGWLVR